MKKMCLLMLIILLSKFGLIAQNIYESPDDNFKADFPCVISVTSSTNSNTYSCNDGMTFLGISVFTHTFMEMEESGDFYLTEMKNLMSQSIPHESIDTSLIDFKGYKCYKIVTKGFMEYEILIFNVYNKMFLIQNYIFKDKGDITKIKKVIDSFEIINTDVLESQMKQYEENKKKKEEMIKKREEYRR